MKFRMAIDDRTHEVEVQQKNPQVKPEVMAVNIDGKVFMVTITEREENSGGTKVKINDREFKVSFEGKDIPNGKQLSLKINEAPFQVRVDTLVGALSLVTEPKPHKVAADVKGEELVAKTPAKASPPGGKVIRPPMPGRIISVKVKEGDNVKVGDIVLILEAMKMANEISSPYAGRVREVRVSPGQSVAPEDAVISIE